jgi:hypothetical protein
MKAIKFGLDVHAAVMKEQERALHDPPEDSSFLADATRPA